MSVSGGSAPRVLLAKPGLDGHDRGIKVVARALRDDGFEVIYLGLRSRSEVIANSAVEEDVAAVGLGISSGGHLGATREVLAALRKVGADELPVVVGGTIPEGDVATLKRTGVAAVFTVGARLDDIVMEFRRLVNGNSGNSNEMAP